MKLQRFVDFQILADPLPDGDGLREVNGALFVVYEPVRLWIKEHRLQAPFRKLVIAFRSEAVSRQWHEHVGIALGTCVVTEAIDIGLLRTQARDHRWVLGVVSHALDCVDRHAGWSSSELRDYLQQLKQKDLPLHFRLTQFAQTERGAGRRYEPWLEASPGCTQIGVSCIGDGLLKREVVVMSKPGPLFLETDFPIAKTAIRGSEFVFLDKSGNKLAAVSLAEL